MALNIYMSKRAKIGLGAGIGVLAILAIVGIAVTTSTNKVVAEDGQDDLYIAEYGLLLEYDHAAGDLSYTIGKQADGQPKIIITNPALKSLQAGCADKSKDEIIGEIDVTTAVAAGDDAPDSYIQNGDTYLVYGSLNDTALDPNDACYDAKTSAQSEDQRTSIFRSFDTLARSAYDDETSDAAATTDPVDTSTEQ